MQIQDEIKQALAQVAAQLIQADLAEVELERPTDSKFGDFSSNLAMQLFAQVKETNDYKSPRDLAQALVDALVKPAQAQKIEIAGPGFINFYLTPEFHFSQAKQLIEQGLPNTLSGEVVVEYSSPNIAKPFTVGHLRSTIIGDAIANLLQSLGKQVYRDNHLGDWGTQFGKQICAIKAWGSEEEIDQAERPVKKLVELYVKFHQETEQNPELEDEAREWFKKLENGDAEARRLWQKCIDWSWVEFDKIYRLLNVHHTENNGRGFGESYFEDKMAAVVDELEKKALLKDSEGAKLVFFPDDKYPPAMITKKDGSSLYMTRDLATDKWRLQTYGPDVQIINEVGGEQQLYFKQLYEIERMLGWMKAGQRVHIKHGLFRFREGKMSTRRGNVIWLEDVLQEAFDRVKTVAGERISQEDIWKIAVAALKWNDLRRKSELDIIFDWDEIARIDGNSGPYMQYSYVRCLSVLEKASQAGVELEQDFSPSSQLLEEESATVALLQQLGKFPEIVEKSAQEYALHHLCVYLFELAQSFSAFYDQNPILQESDTAKQHLRLLAVSYTAQVLKQGLEILGIELVEKM
jgi:arginyl-tRNA synthetase